MCISFTADTAATEQKSTKSNYIFLVSGNILFHRDYLIFTPLLFYLFTSPHPIPSHHNTEHFISSHLSSYPLLFFFFFCVLSFSFLLRPWLPIAYRSLNHPLTYPFTPQNQRHSYLVRRFMLTNYLYLPSHTLSHKKAQHEEFYECLPM